MQINALFECGLVSDVEELNQRVEFKTFIYSAKTMQMERVTVSCPLSGDYMLTESAEIISGDVDPADAGDLLEQVFFGLKHTSTDGRGQPQAGQDPVSQFAQRAAMKFLEAVAAEQSADMRDVESLRFGFLKVCSINFQQVYDQIETRN